MDCLRLRTCNCAVTWSVLLVSATELQSQGQLKLQQCGHCHNHCQSLIPPDNRTSPGGRLCSSIYYLLWGRVHQRDSWTTCWCSQSHQPVTPSWKWGELNCVTTSPIKFKNVPRKTACTCCDNLANSIQTRWSLLIYGVAWTEIHFSLNVA